MKVTVLVVLLAWGLTSYAQVSDFDHISFRKADSIAMSYKGFSLEDMPKLSGKLVANLDTDIERFRAIYMWTCTNIANDYDLFKKHKRKRKRYMDDSLKLAEWNKELSEILFDKLLKRKKTICTGYAYVLKQLSKFAGIRCRIIDGFARTNTISIDGFSLPNHSWTAVQLNGKWYLCDATWASGVSNVDTGDFKFEYNNGFFLTAPELFVKNHYPADLRWTLLAEDQIPSFDAFLEGPLIYGEAYKVLEEHSTPQKMHNTVNTKETITFQYQLQNKVNTDKVQLVIDSGINNKKMNANPKIGTDNSMTITHQFQKTGLYDVHLLINDEYITTYVFEVIE